MPVDFVDATRLGCVKGGNIKKREWNGEIWSYGLLLPGCTRGRKETFAMQTPRIVAPKKFQAVTLTMQRQGPKGPESWDALSEAGQGACANVQNLLSQEDDSGFVCPMSSKQILSSTKSRLSHQHGMLPKNPSPKHKVFVLICHLFPTVSPLWIILCKQDFPKVFWCISF